VLERIEADTAQAPGVSSPSRRATKAMGRFMKVAAMMTGITQVDASKNVILIPGCRNESRCLSPHRGAHAVFDRRR